MLSSSRYKQLEALHLSMTTRTFSSGDTSKHGKTMHSLLSSWCSRKLPHTILLFMSHGTSLEMFARIAVCGLLLDPDVPTSSLLTSPFSQPDLVVPASTSETGVSIARHVSIGHSGSHTAGLSRGLTLTSRLRHLRSNLARPFTLPDRSTSTPMSSSVVDPGDKRPSTSRARSDTVQSKSPMIEKAERLHSHLRNPSQPTFFSKALRSDNGDVLSLPFRLSVQQAHGTTERNLPYLRHSWTRIDFIAVVSFWITFALAVTGVERGTYHIGIFRALSVLRTARLLAITSGTTVSGIPRAAHALAYPLNNSLCRLLCAR